MTEVKLSNDKQTANIREYMDLLKELDADEKLQVKGIMIGMKLGKVLEVAEKK